MNENWALVNIEMIEKIKSLYEKKEELVPVEFKKKKEKVKKIKIKRPRWSWIKNFISLNNKKLVFIKNLSIYSISYGVIINYMLWGIFGVHFGILSFPSYGLLFHFLKEELPLVFSKFFYKNR